MNPSHLTIRIKRIHAESEDIPLPAYATPGSSGMDVCAAVEVDVVIKPGETALIPSGFVMEIPHGYEGQIRPRSGLAVRNGIGILNSPGTIDSDYRGELKVILTNFGKENFIIHRGDRVAQLVIAPVVRADWEEVHALEATARGAGGFGHTGR